MKLFLNSRNEVHDVGNTSDTSLNEVIVTDGTFDSWTVARLCCYCVSVIDGIVYGYWPYVNSIVIEQLDKAGKRQEANTNDIVVTQLGIVETCEALYLNADTITNVELAVTELYESVLG